MTNIPKYRKSSYSQQNGACVEIALTHDRAGRVRDSKNPNGPVLVVDIAAMVAMLKANS